jgi:hypothetical protein
MIEKAKKDQAASERLRAVKKDGNKYVALDSGGRERRFDTKEQALAFWDKEKASSEAARVAGDAETKRAGDKARQDAVDVFGELIDLAASGELQKEYQNATPERQRAIAKQMGDIVRTVINDNPNAIQDMAAPMREMVAAQAPMDDDSVLSRAAGAAFDPADKANADSRDRQRLSLLERLGEEDFPAAIYTDTQYDAANKRYEDAEKRVSKIAGSGKVDPEVMQVRDRQGRNRKDEFYAVDPVRPSQVKDESFVSKAGRQDRTLEVFADLATSNPDQFMKNLSQLLPHKTSNPEFLETTARARKQDADLPAGSYADKIPAGDKVPTSTVEQPAFDGRRAFIEKMTQVFPDFQEPGMAFKYMPKVGELGGRVVVEAQDGVLLDLWTGQPFQAPEAPVQPIMTPTQPAPMANPQQPPNFPPGGAPPGAGKRASTPPAMSPQGVPQQGGAMAQLQEMMSKVSGAVDSSQLSAKAATAEAGGGGKVADLLAMS